MDSDKQSIIQYSHTDFFHWKKDWWKPMRWWCKWTGHSVQQRMYDRSYMVKMNEQDWRQVKDQQPVLFCTSCKTVISFTANFDVKSVNQSIAHMQVTEGKKQ